MEYVGRSHAVLTPDHLDRIEIEDIQRTQVLGLLNSPRRPNLVHSKQGWISLCLGGEGKLVN